MKKNLVNKTKPGLRFGKLMLTLLIGLTIIFTSCKDQLLDDNSIDADAASKAVGGGTIANAQSQMISLNLAGGKGTSTYFINGTTTWSFGSSCAGTPAEKLVNTSATEATSNFRTCANGGRDLGQCSDSNAPVTPIPTYAEIVAALTSSGGASWSNAEKATFYCGGTITRTGTLKLTRTGVNGSGTWTYTYNISASTNAMAAKTCWTSETNTNGLNINYNGFAAGESVQTRSSGTWTTKYSFGMTTTVTDPVTTLPVEVSRCQNVTAYLERTSDNINWTAVANQPVDASVISTTILAADGITEIPYDVSYYGNAGTAGATAALGMLHAPGRKGEALVSSIVLSDNFSANNSEVAQRAILNGAGFNITSDPGTYRIRLVGTIKGNTGTVDAGFNVSTSFNVIGDPGCGN